MAAGSPRRWRDAETHSELARSVREDAERGADRRLMTLAIAGCGGDDESPAGSGGPGSSGGAQLAGPLTFTRGGGIAGRADKLVVQPDGSVSLTTRSGGERA